MKNITLITFIVASFLFTGCNRGLNTEQKNKIAELVKQAKSEIEQMRVSDTTFTNSGYDLNEEFEKDLLEQSINNLSKAVDAISSGGMESFNATAKEQLQMKLDRQNKLSDFQKYHITQTGEWFGKYYLEILGVIKGSPIENNNEALMFTIYNQIPKEWHEITTEYISIQDSALRNAFEKVMKTSEVRDKINTNIEIAFSFLDKVVAKSNE
jgi:hypothetical protein